MQRRFFWPCVWIGRRLSDPGLFSVLLLLLILFFTGLAALYLVRFTDFLKVGWRTWLRYTYPCWVSHQMSQNHFRPGRQRATLDTFWRFQTMARTNWKVEIVLHSCNVLLLRMLIWSFRRDQSSFVFWRRIWSFDLSRSRFLRIFFFKPMILQKNLLSILIQETALTFVLSFMSQNWGTHFFPAKPPHAS